MGNISHFDFKEAKQSVYRNFEFSFFEGESSADAQGRAIKILEYILKKYDGKSVVIETHGDIKTLMLNHYDQQYGYDFWESTSMPDIYRLEFLDRKIIKLTKLWEIFEEGNDFS